MRLITANPFVIALSSGFRNHEMEYQPEEAQMNKIRFSQLVLCGLLVLTMAYQAAGQPFSAAMFRPGDTLGGMTLTTGAQDAAPVWAFCSPAQHVGNTTTSDCSVPLVPRLAVGHIIMPGDDALSRLDWSEIRWELTIEGQPVDLKSFGTYNFALPARSHSPLSVKEVFVHFTAWDVVLTNLNPGQYTIHGLARMGAESHNWVIHLTIEEDALGAGASWVGPDFQETS
jgi:hypothetical protein